jgi:hypothetical protein
MAGAERSPVVGPLVGVGVALSGTITAATEGDRIAATVFESRHRRTR